MEEGEGAVEAAPQGEEGSGGKPRGEERPEEELEPGVEGGELHRAVASECKVGRGADGLESPGRKEKEIGKRRAWVAAATAT